VKRVPKPRGGKKTDWSDSSDVCVGSSQGSGRDMSVAQKMRAKVNNNPPPGLESPGPAFLSSQEDDEDTIRGSAFTALQESLSNLTPEDAAQVHAFLKAKEAAAPMSMGWNSTSSTVQSNRPVRPFTPFQGPRKTPGRAPMQRQSDAPATKPANDANETSETLRSSLYELSLMDSAKVIMVRKISKLGLDSARLLEAYFSKFGIVERSLANHTRSTTKWGETRLRPATVGFVVMSSADVKTILDYNGEHSVQGCPVSVFPFQSHSID